MALLCLSLVGCNTPTEKYASSISEIRDAVYEGTGDGFQVTAVSGVHEQPFKPDGEVGKKTEFTVITLRPEEFLPGSLYSYTIDINGNAYSGVLTMHPFGESFSVEIAERTHEAVLSLGIRYEGRDMQVELKTVCEEDDATPDQALETAMTALEAELASMKSGNSYACEIYIRFIPNPINAEGGYYWYVAFVTDNSSLAVLMERKDCAVIAKKS